MVESGNLGSGCAPATPLTRPTPPSAPAWESEEEHTSVDEHDKLNRAAQAARAVQEPAAPGFEYRPLAEELAGLIPPRAARPLTAKQPPVSPARTALIDALTRLHARYLEDDTADSVLRAAIDVLLGTERGTPHPLTADELAEEVQRMNAKRPPAPPVEARTLYQQIGTEIGALVTEKNAAYGSSFNRVAEFLTILYPTGVTVAQYTDMLCLARIFDKMMRIATRKHAFNESPYEDIAGYGILGAALDRERGKAAAT